MTTVVAAPNAFKGTYDPVVVAERWEAVGLPGVRVVPRPMTDGGDGMLDVVRYYRPSTVVARLRVRDAASRPVAARWGWGIGDNVAYVESAEVVGLRRVPEPDRRPLDATSYGLGQMIGAIGGLNVGTIVVGLGGSATIDGGLGAARALGFRFEDGRGRAVESPGHLARLSRIVPPERPPLPSQTRVIGLVDVVNPAIGAAGAAPVFGPQKGAGAAEIAALEEGLSRLAACAHADLGAPQDAPTVRGSGAAGGLGMALRVFLGARIVRGAVWCARLARLDAAMAGADAIVTGEGRYDGLGEGKATRHVVSLAHRAGVPAAVVSAAHAKSIEDVRIIDSRRLDRVDSGPVSLEELTLLFRLAIDDLGL